MGVGGDHAGIGHKKTAAGFLRTLQLHDGGFGDCGQSFERKFWSEVCGSGGQMCRDASSKGCGDQFERDVELLAFKQPVLVAIFAVQGTPFHRAFAKDDFFSGVAGEGQACDELVLEVRADGGLGYRMSSG